MDKNTGFSYSYSASANKEVLEIRKKYMPTEESRYEELKRLDYQVQTSGMIESLSVGIAGFLLFGFGICMALKIIGGSMLLGILLGLIGLVTMLFAYPVYRSILRKTKEKLVPRILELTAELTGNN